MDPRHYAQLAIQETEYIVAKLDVGSLKELVKRISEADSVFLAGAGRSLLMQRAFAMRLMHLGLSAHVVGDVTTPAIGPGDLLVIASGSGETATLIVLAEKATAAGASLAVLTIHSASTLAKNAESVVVIPGATDKVVGDFESCQPAGSSFEQALLMTLDGMVMALAEQMGSELNRGFVRHTNLE